MWSVNHYDALDIALSLFKGRREKRKDVISLLSFFVSQMRPTDRKAND